MDQDQAKLILASFRPNGSDLSDPAFSEALSLAAEDKNLGQWLANERAQDLDFADILSEFPIPEGLRENLFEALALAMNSPGYDEFDHEFSSGLAAIRVPENLRNDILAAMEVEQKIATLPTVKKSKANSKRTRNWFSMQGMGIAAAAGIVLALVWTVFLKPASAQRELADMTAESVKTEALNFLSGNISLDRRDPKQEALYQFLASNELPSPEQLPEGLGDAIGIGCKRLDFNEHPASLICYKEGKKTVHLIVLRRDSIEGELPQLAEAEATQSERPGWSAAAWRDEDKAFFLLSKMQPSQLASMF